jgi:hypothetical protein
VKKFFVVGILLAMVVILAACAAGPNTMVNTAPDGGEIAGFWQGLWHGFISPFTFLISLFKDDIGIYETFNNGGWYNFGYLFGLSIIFGSGGRTSKRTKK